MIELLKRLDNEFDDHIIRYGRIEEYTADDPVEVRVRDGSVWAMTYFPIEIISDKGAQDILISTLTDRIKEERGG